MDPSNCKTASAPASSSVSNRNPQRSLGESGDAARITMKIVRIFRQASEDQQAMIMEIGMNFHVSTNSLENAPVGCTGAFTMNNARGHVILGGLSFDYTCKLVLLVGHETTTHPQLFAITNRLKYSQPKNDHQWSMWNYRRSNQVFAPVHATSMAEKHRMASAPFPPIPKDIQDISNGDHILGFGANLAEDHPGYNDFEYKRRRSYIADLAKTHIMGTPIPEVDYSVHETQVWGDVLDTLLQLYPTHACTEYLQSYPLFNFSRDHIPQLQKLSEVLQRTTGWQIRPVAGLLHPRDFLNGLAFRTFHSTQYIRHGSNPIYTPEPDLCHETLGHVPMLANPEFADLAFVIGQASLGVSEKGIWHLTKLYWYTVEFGTVKEGDQIKAFGAGLLSSYGELRYMRDGIDGVRPEFIELDPFKKLPKMSYKDGFQKKYFLYESFADAAAKLRLYAKSILSVNVETTLSETTRSQLEKMNQT